MAITPKECRIFREPCALKCPGSDWCVVEQVLPSVIEKAQEGMRKAVSESNEYIYFQLDSDTFRKIWNKTLDRIRR